MKRLNKLLTSCCVLFAIWIFSLLGRGILTSDNIGTILNDIGIILMSIFMIYWFAAPCFMDLSVRSHTTYNMGMTVEEKRHEKWEQDKKEELRKAQIWLKEYDRKQCELAQQKTVRVKQYYRKKPKKSEVVASRKSLERKYNG